MSSAAERDGREAAQAALPPTAPPAYLAADVKARLVPAEAMLAKLKRKAAPKPPPSPPPPVEAAEAQEEAAAEAAAEGAAEGPAEGEDEDSPVHSELRKKTL